MARARVLVIDDEPEVGAFLQQHLGDLGYDVESVLVAEDGLEKIRNDPPEVVLLDIRMPGMGGVETLLKIRELSPKTKVIMVTAVQEEELARQTLKLGATDYITKALHLNYLETSLLAALHSSEVE
ncbi:MAG: response regulator [Candidatus Tectomicrobia bacterium]|nr:response regulator [Candidatus Tectomicrobia bacterium]